MKCRVCHAENKFDAKFCAKCGGAVAAAPTNEATSVICTNCQHACRPDAKFCPKCGQSFTPANPVHTTEPGTGMASAPTIPTPVAPVVPANETPTEPCPHCAAPVKIGARFCGTCGQAINPGLTASEHTALAPAAIEPVPDLASKSAIEPTTEPVPEPTPGTPALPSAEIRDLNLPLSHGKFGTIIVIVMIVALLLAALGTGAYYLMQSKDSASSNITLSAAAQPASANESPTESKAAPAPVPSIEAQPKSETALGIDPKSETVIRDLPVAPEPKAAQHVEPIAQTPTAAEPAPKPAKSKPTPPPKPAADGADSALNRIIDDTLAAATQCMNRKKYDCAIANADTVLRMAPANQRANSLKRQAKAAQDKALSDIQIE